jgi:hypothetical protein
VRKNPAPYLARVSISAIPNAKSTESGTDTATNQSVFLTAGHTCGSTVNAYL